MEVVLVGHSSSTCADSLARNRRPRVDPLAGAVEHGRDRVLGQPVDLEVGMEHAAARWRWRRSRRAWPRPIGEDRYSARGGRRSARLNDVQVGRGWMRSTNCSIAAFTTIGSRAWGPWPPPSTVSRSPPVTSARAATGGVGPDGVLVAVDHEDRARTRSQTERKPSRPHSVQPAQRVGDHVGVVVECPPDAVLDLLGRVRLGEHLAEEELEEAGVVAVPVRGGCTWPSPPRRPGRSSNGWTWRSGCGGASGTAGPMETSPMVRSGWSAATWTAHSVPHDRATSTARSVPVASRTASVSAANSWWVYAAAPTGRSDRPVPRPSNVTTR